MELLFNTGFISNICIIILFSESIYCLNGNSITKLKKFRFKILLSISIVYLTNRELDFFRGISVDILYCFFWNDLDILSNLRSHIVEVSLYVLLGCLAVILPIILNKKFRKSIFNFKFESDRLFVIIVIVITLNIIIFYLIGIKDSIISAKLFHYSINTTGLLRGVIYEIFKYTFLGFLEEFFYIFSIAFFIEYILRESEYSENKKSFITVLTISIPFLLSHEYSFIFSNGSGILFVYSLFTRLYQVFISVYIRKKTNNILLTTLIHMLWNVSVSLPAYLDNI